ncbi:MAG: hypothetical protein QW331_01510 [Candidatus Woesearchaeota archaeon]
MSNVYQHGILCNIKRLLSLEDRNVGSPTYGCFDRSYWHYKQTDFACARSQEAVLTLAYIYSIPFKDNIYYKNPNIKEWILAGIKFWTQIQNKNGSFNEWYPDESSYVATAFSAFAISEALIAINEKPEKEVIDALEKAALYLKKRKERRVVNQEAGASAALLNIYLLTKKRSFLEAFDEKKEEVLKGQHEEGWWEEYGSVDAGYLSWTLYYLTKIFQKTKDKKIRDAICKALEFLDEISFKWTVGAEVTSRNTDYLAPLSFEYFKTEASKHLAAISRSKDIADLFSLDDRYLSYMAYCWLDASQYADKKVNFNNKNISKFFKGAGISIMRNKKQLIYSTKKGGAFKLKIGNYYYFDSGILVRFGNRLCGSGFYSEKTSYTETTSEGKLVVIDQKPLSFISYSGIRILSKTLFKNRLLAQLLKEKLRSLLIMRKKLSKIGFKRTFTIQQDSIIITDQLYQLPKNSKIYLGEKYSFTFIPSSRYFILSELNQKGKLEIENNEKTAIRIVRTITEKGQRVKIK